MECGTFDDTSDMENISQSQTSVNEVSAQPSVNHRPHKQLTRREKAESAKENFLEFSDNVLNLSESSATQAMLQVRYQAPDKFLFRSDK